MFSKVFFFELVILYAEIRAMMTGTKDVVLVCMAAIILASFIDWRKDG